MRALVSARDLVCACFGRPMYSDNFLQIELRERGPFAHNHPNVTAQRSATPPLALVSISIMVSTTTPFCCSPLPSSFTERALPVLNENHLSYRTKCSFAFSFSVAEVHQAREVERGADQNRNGAETVRQP